jgi:hypothetical protein
VHLKELEDKNQFLSSELAVFQNSQLGILREEINSYLEPLLELIQSFRDDFSCQLQHARKEKAEAEEGFKDLATTFCWTETGPSYELFSAFNDLAVGYQAAQKKRAEQLAPPKVVKPPVGGIRMPGLPPGMANIAHLASNAKAQLKKVRQSPVAVKLVRISLFIN